MAQSKQRRHGPLPSENDAHVSFKMPLKDRERLYAYAKLKGATGAQMIRELLIPQIRKLDLTKVELGEDQPSFDDVEQLKKSA